MKRQKTIAEMVAERDELEREARDLISAAEAENRELVDDEVTRFDEITEKLNAVREEHRKAEARINEIRNLASNPKNREGSNASMVRNSQPRIEIRDQAMRTLERSTKSLGFAPESAETVERMLGHDENSFVARCAVATGSEEYRQAFAKLLSDPERGHLLFTPAEADAYRKVAAIQHEQRAMGESSGPTGAYMVPLTLDPSVVLTSSGSVNPLRAIARVVQTNTNSWSGITSAGVTAEWTAEAAEMSDASPTLGNPVINVHKADAYVPFSWEVEMDALGFLGELRKLLLDGAEQLTAAAYTTGTGTGQPKGLVTALVAAGGSVLVSGAGEALTAGDFYGVQNALGPRFQPNAKWMLNLSSINALRQLETSNGSLVFPGLQVVPPALLGRPVFENSVMDGTINAAATESNYVAVYGDFANYVIVDRIGTQIELIPQLFGPNRRPTGQRGAVLWFRTGADVVNSAAFKVLRINTTA